MDFAELFQSAKGTAAHLGDNGAVKLIGASVMGVACSMHGQLLFAFVGLVLLDLMTKWIALSRQHIKKRRKKTEPSLWECFCNIRKARRAGYIKSEPMKHRFLGKILVYFLVVFAGGLIDYTMTIMDKPTWAVLLLVGYLSITELISIVENLQDAGVEEAAHLHEILEKKRDVLK